MSRFTVKELQRKFIKYANSDEFPNTAVEWHEYDGQVRIVFVWVEGEWNAEIRDKLTIYLRKFHRKLLVSRMIRTTEEKPEEDDEDYI